MLGTSCYGSVVKLHSLGIWIGIEAPFTRHMITWINGVILCHGFWYLLLSVMIVSLFSSISCPRKVVQALE